ncbi:hypothetical protein MPER_08678 [Moniliophthora perniciosa FA553]|nr:hypothetical protein MPER_08678 [Moniliophthora perniciosa FA553]
MHVHSLAIPLLLLISALVHADFVLFESNEYQTGILGSAPSQNYYSSDSTPAAWNFIVPYSTERSTSNITPGYLFVAPRSTVSAQHGAVIYAQDGTMIWDGKEYGEAMAFKVVTWMGEPHICLWQGEFFGLGLGSGHTILLNQKYEVVANYTTALEGETGLTYADFHETDITVNNTALLAAYQLRTMDLTAYGGSSSGWIYDSVVQELNVTSGQAIWTWKAGDHIDPGECTDFYAWGTYNQTGDVHDTAWDYFHINSIEKDNSGNYLISSRHCSTIYYLDGSDGHVIWRLGGRETSFSMGEGTQFAYQHDSRWLVRNETLGRISLFNNAGLMAGVYSEDSARGMVLELDFEAMSATLVQDYFPLALAVSETQGSVQVQPNGDVLIG